MNLYRLIKVRVLQKYNSRKISPWLLAGALSAGALGSASSSAETIRVYGKTFTDDSIPLLIDPSLPAFATKINANYYSGSEHNGHALIVTESRRNSVFLVPGSPPRHRVAKTDYNLTAYFDESGAFTSGTVSISGRLRGSSTSSMLMTADLVSFGMNDYGTMWGFNTDNIVCSAAINAIIGGGGCTEREVVYIAFKKAHGTSGPWHDRGVALTSVPVPAAVWLFGTGLIGLLGIARRSKVV